MDAELAQALVVDKVSSIGLLLVGVILVWRRYAATSDRLIAELKTQTTEVTAKLGELKGALEVGLAGVRGQLETHGRRLDEHQRRLDRHSNILRAVDLRSPGRSGIYARPHLVAASEDENEEP